MPLSLPSYIILVGTRHCRVLLIYWIAMPSLFIGLPCTPDLLVANKLAKVLVEKPDFLGGFHH